MSAPAVLSIVIAAYNAEATLADQFSALLAEPPPVAWEIVISDNGSSDSTSELVAQWAETHPEIRLVDSAERRGPAAARNIGVAASTGRFIAFCDADDIVGAGWTAALLKALAEHSFIAGRFEVERLRGRSPFMISWSPQLNGLTQLPYLPGFQTAGAGNMAMHREVFERIGGFDEGALTSEDDDLCLRAQLAGYPLTFVPGMLLHVRRRAGLIHVWRQGKAQGIGARRLEHKYALISAQLTAAQSMHASDDASPAPATPGPAVRHRARRVLNPGWIPSRIANLVWRRGWKRGWNVANLEEVSQVIPHAYRRPDE